MSRRAKMFQLVDEYLQSGVSVRKFSEDNGVKAGTLRYWIRKKEEVAFDGGFVKIDNHPVFHADLELVYPNGVRLRTSPQDLGLVKKLLELY